MRMASCSNFKGNHIATFSHLISLITDTGKRHALETLFREAKGRKSTQLPRAFIKSIGADQCTSSSPLPSNEKDVFIPGMIKAKSTGNLADNHPSPTSPVEKPWKSLAYPSSLPISRSLQDEWREYKWNLAHYNDLSKLIVEKRRVVSSKILLNVGDMAVEVMRILDEVLLERAKREQWPVIDEERIASMSMHLIVREQGERQLGSMD